MSLNNINLKTHDIVDMSTCSIFCCVSGNSLLSLFHPLLVSVCTKQAKYPEPGLQAAASLALAKYMLVR